MISSNVESAPLADTRRAAPAAANDATSAGPSTSKDGSILTNVGGGDASVAIMCYAAER
jgi:hypothetical protein